MGVTQGSLSSVAETMLTLLQDSFKTSFQGDSNQMSNEAQKQKCLIDVLDAHVKLAREIAIVKKIDAAEEVIVEELYDKHDGALTKKIYILKSPGDHTPETDNRQNPCGTTEPTTTTSKRIHTHISKFD